jgi:hypothetical protein
MRTTTAKMLTALSALGLAIGLGLLGSGQGTPQGVIPQPPTPDGLRIEVWTDQAAYQVGQNVQIGFTLNKDGYVYFYNVDGRCQVFNLFPNQFSANNFLKAGSYTLPDSATWVLKVSEATGLESIVGIVTAQPVPLPLQQILGAQPNLTCQQFPQSAQGAIQGILPQASSWATDFALLKTLSGPPPASGALGVSSTPTPGAAIYVDGLLRGFTNKSRIALEVGPHTVKVARNCPGLPVLAERSHFESRPQTIPIQPGQLLPLTALLEPRYEDFESGGLVCLPWQTGGNVPWGVQNRIVAAGSFSAQAGAIGHNQRSSLQITVNVPAGGGTVSFRYRVSSEGCCDFLRFAIDGVEQNSWAGETGWQTASFSVPAGEHTLSWTYTKDGSVVSGSDTAWLDEISLP